MQTIKQTNHTIYISHDTQKGFIDYFLSGVIKNDKFSGVIGGYVGGGEVDEWYIFENKFLPSENKDKDSIEYDEAAKLLDMAIGDINFIDNCYREINKFIKANKDGSDSLKSQYLQNCEIDNDNDKNIIIKSENDFNLINFGNRKFGIDDLDYYETLEVFIETNLNFKVLVKKELQNQIDIDVNREKDSSELINETMTVMVELFSKYMEAEDVSNYISSIVSEIENRANGEESNLCNINIDECEICICCKEVLLPDDECYGSHDGEPLCDGCSIMCEGCDKYYTDKEGSYDEHGFICNICNSDEIKIKINFLELLSKADAITIGNSPFLMSWNLDKSEGDLISTNWQEEDLEYECNINAIDIIRVEKDKNRYKLIFDNRVEIITLIKIEYL